MVIFPTHIKQRKGTNASMPLWTLLLIPLILIGSKLVTFSRLRGKRTELVPTRDWIRSEWRIIKGKLCLFNTEQPQRQIVDGTKLLEDALHAFITECDTHDLKVNIQSVEISVHLAYALYAEGLLTQQDFESALPGLTGTIDMPRFSAFPSLRIRLSILRNLEYPFHFIVEDPHGTTHPIRTFEELTESMTREEEGLEPSPSS